MAGNKQGIGDGRLTFGPLKIEYGPKGTTTHFTVTCLTLAPLINYYNYVIQYGASGEFLGCDNGLDGVTGAEVKTLEVSVPGLVNNLAQFLTELYFDSWELLSNETTDSIFNNPLIVGSAGWMNDNDKVILSFIATNGGEVADAITASNADVTAGTLPAPTVGGSGGKYIAPTDARSQQLLLEIKKGQSEFARPSKVLRHTSYCSPGALYNNGIGYEEYIYTPAQLLSEVGSGWTYNLPPRLYSEIAAQPFQYAPTTEASYYRWGWKKTIGREPVLANFMIERTVEYALGLWSTIRYASR